MGDELKQNDDYGMKAKLVIVMMVVIKIIR